MPAGIEKKQKHIVYFHWSQNQKGKETEKWDISPSLSQNLSRASFCLSRESIYAFIYKPGSSICSGKQTICCIDTDLRACCESTFILG